MNAALGDPYWELYSVGRGARAVKAHPLYIHTEDYNANFVLVRVHILRPCNSTVHEAAIEFIRTACGTEGKANLVKFYNIYLKHFLV
jgi:hypothetical protein